MLPEIPSFQIAPQMVMLQLNKIVALDVSDKRSRGLEFDLEPGPILLLRLMMKSFLWPFSSLPLIQEGLLSVTSESMCMKYWLTA